MSTCNDCPTLDECAERRACQRRHGAITWPLYPKVMEPREANEYAQAINARVTRATEALLTRAARFFGSIVAAVVLGLYAIGAVWGGS